MKKYIFFSLSVNTLHALLLDTIENYGCWCNFGPRSLYGYGRAQDKLDEICRDYTLCLRCPNKELLHCDYSFYLDPDYSSSKMMTPNVLWFSGLTDPKIEEFCQTSSFEECESHACICTSKLMIQLIQTNLLFQNGSIRVNESYENLDRPKVCGDQDLFFDNEKLLPTCSLPVFENVVTEIDLKGAICQTSCDIRNF